MANQPSFEMKLEGDLLDKLSKAGSKGEKEIYDALNRGSGYLWQKTIEEAPASDGTLRKSIRRELNPTSAQILPTEKYGIFVHEGTRPHFPPMQELKPGGSIYRWAQKHGIPPYAVAISIARKGTKGKPWLTNALKTYERDILQEFEVALDNIAQFLSD